MILKENIDVELSFICSKQVQNLEDFNNNVNNLIFQSSYWESIFNTWIKIIINENLSNKLIYLSHKKIFSLSFNITDNNEISILNKRWLNKIGPTDVLSFPIITEEKFEQDLLFIELGDLFISLEMASIQSKEYKNSLKKEMLFLASHGFLHLLGWEHESENDLKKMLDFQEYLISKIN